MREKIILICEDCLSRNYHISKKQSQKNNKMTIRKFCKKCNKHTKHKESR